MRSESIHLGGNGQINVLVAGGRDINALYVAPTSSSNFRVYWDASRWLDERLHIKVVDRARGGFGHINLDAVHVPGRLAP